MNLYKKNIIFSIKITYFIIKCFKFYKNKLSSEILLSKYTINIAWWIFFNGRDLIVPNF